jgi:hypothetical protein
MAPPKVTFTLACFEQEAFVRDAVRSALEQDYSPLEVILSDDCSGDGTFDILEEEAAKYDGPHTVRVNRNPENLGGPGHFDKVMKLACGEFVVIGHGDDISMPQRTRRLVETWTAHKVSLVSSNAAVIDADARPMGLVNEVGGSRAITIDDIIGKGWQSTMLGSTLACHQDVVRQFLRLDTQRLIAGLDHVLPFRAGLLKGAYYVGEPLLQWRQHDRNVGDTVADKTGSGAVAVETYSAYILTAQMCMLEDLQAFRRRGPDSRHLAALQQRLVNQVLTTTLKWTRQRNRLLLTGQRPTWVDKAELDQKPIRPEQRLPPRVPEA